MVDLENQAQNQKRRKTNQERKTTNSKIRSIYKLLEKETGRHGILEIKTTEIRAPTQWKEWDGRIPQAYYAQICHQLNATGWEFAVLKARIRYQKDGELRIAERQYTIEQREAREDMHYVLQKEIEFWKYIKDGQRPPLILPGI